MTNAQYSELYWTTNGVPRLMYLVVPNIGIMLSPLKDMPEAAVKVGLAKAFDFAREAVFEGFERRVLDSKNANTIFLEYLNLGIQIYVPGFGSSSQGLTIPGAPPSVVRNIGFWASPN